MDFLVHGYDEEHRYGARVALGPIATDQVAGPLAPPAEAMAKSTKEEKAESTIASLWLD